MAEKIWWAKRLIGSPDGLQFAFTLYTDDQEGLAWGEGQILLEGEPVWFGEGPEGEEIPLVWTWIDLLEFLGRWWPWLILEEDYPLPLQPLYPAFFIQDAERRWFELPEDQVEEEEEVAHRFIARHDLADAFKGLFLPSLILLRQGKTCHISVAAVRRTRVRPWSEIQDALEEVGEYLVNAVSSSDHPRAVHARKLWTQRKERLIERELDLATGLSMDVRKRFHNIDWRASEIQAVAYPEKRARAFAAEFLLPRQTAEAVVRCQPSLQKAAHFLQQTYRISTELLAWQINNSSARMALSGEERTLLEQWKTGRTEL